MKSLRRLVVVLLFLQLPALAQGVRMSADFFPLEVGRSWIYDVTNETGEKIGQIAFAVEDYTIVSGTSFYVLSEFPFPTEASEPIRFVRYDRDDRYFLRRLRNDDGPLFENAGATTEVLESDASGAPRKFVLRRDRMALTFQRGIGIVEARFERDGVARIAKLTDARTKPAPVPASPAVGAPVTAQPPVSPTRPSRPEASVGAVTAANPRIDVAVEPSAGGYRFVMVVTNLSDSLLPFRFNSGKTYDFVVHDAASGKEVWRWSNGNFFTQMLRSDSIRPRGKWQFEVIWDRKDNDGNPVSAGSYRLSAIITASPALQATPVEFEVK